MHPAISRETSAVQVVTARCLIATDVDKTILSQGPHLAEERQSFFQRVAPELAEAARLGAHIGFITGNSMHELCSRLLRPLLDELHHRSILNVLSHFHFFCNSGGVYFHLNEREVLRLVNSRGDRARAVTLQDHGEIYIHPRLIDSQYVERCMITDDDAPRIRTILEQAAEQYTYKVTENLKHYELQYDLSWVLENGSLKRPQADMRFIKYRAEVGEKLATVQITLKPVLSFRQAREGFETALFNHDLRTEVISSIQENLMRSGLDHYVARAGGRGSVDVTLARLNKAYALEFLIDRLRLQGNEHRGQLSGSNTIYFGDEVIVGSGNDYPVTRIPGLMTFAVNPDKNLVPFLSPVLVASAIFHGPDATADIVSHFNNCARRLLAQYSEDQSVVRTAIELLKEEIFSKRIEDKIMALKHHRKISVDEWQTLHTFVTLMSRESPVARQWLSVLAKQLDSIMIQLANSAEPAVIPALGTSRPKND